MRSTLEVHQFLPSFNLPDAVGYHTLRTKEDLLNRGIKGAIWGEEVRGDLQTHAKRYSGYTFTRSARSGRNIHLYQASTGSRGLVEYLLTRRENLTLCYHNITPPEFFEPYDAGAALALKRGREELQSLATRVGLAFACSQFNATELIDMGIGDVRVLPPYLPVRIPTVDTAFSNQLRKEKRGIDLLFVGRVVPNKGHVHLLRAFAALREQDPGARLFIAGAWGPEAYIRTLFALRDRMGHTGCNFTGAVTGGQLSALYQQCDFFISLSEHEGFGIPLIEAMRSDLPVVAYRAGGVPETMGAAGVLIDTLDPAFVSEVILQLSNDEDIKRSVIEKQRERAKEIEEIPRDAILVDAITYMTGS